MLGRDINKPSNDIWKALDKVLEEPTILYECDRRACSKCSPECSYTRDIRHARNFELSENIFVEVIPPYFEI